MPVEKRKLAERRIEEDCTRIREANSHRLAPPRRAHCWLSSGVCLFMSMYNLRVGCIFSQPGTEDAEMEVPTVETEPKRILSLEFAFCQSVCLPACLPACLPVCLSVCLPACLPACLPVCLSHCLTVFLSVCLSACLSVCLSHCLSACLPSCLPLIIFHYECLDY